MKLAGKCVLVAGGRRVGGRLATLLARRGAHVALSYRASRQRIEEVVAEVKQFGVRGAAIAADLRQAESAEHLVRRTVEELGALDVLVNMVSEYFETPLETLTARQFDEVLASNLVAPARVALAAAAIMLRQPAVDGLRGKIINFTDWAIDRPYKGYLPYFAAKGGLAALTRALAVELAPSITVNAVAPAMIDPPPDLTPEDIDRVTRATPLKRVGTPDDANNLVLYLLEGTDFATGATFTVDGGRTLG